MADVSDIESILVSTLAQIIYPNGTAQPSITGTPCRVYRGWPVPVNLDSDLKAGITNISIFPQNNEKNTTRYPRTWEQLPVVPSKLTLTVSGNTITVGGIPATANAAALVNGIAYVYPVQAGNGTTQIATGLAALINADTTATSSGNIITILGVRSLLARVGTTGTLIREIRRQKRGIQITFWCPNPALRDAIVSRCDAALGELTFITLPDGSAGRITYDRTSVSDRVENEGVYRRDLFYSVEYGTTDSQSAPQIVTELFALIGAIDPAPIKTFSL